MKMFTKFASAAAVAVTLGAAMPASANVIQLGFLLDRSGSIGGANWTTIVTGLSTAIGTLVPTDGRYEISVVSFGSDATTVVDTVVIDSAATRAAVAASIAAAGFTGGSTAMDVGLDLLNTVLGGSTETIDFTYVNIATDGVPNSTTAAVASRDTMISDGIDNISIEGIGGGVDAAFLQGSICYPLACDTTSPYNFPTQGFYIAVPDAAGYAAAIGNKIRVVTNQAPEPMTIALFGLGLAGLGYMRRKAA